MYANYFFSSFNHYRNKLFSLVKKKEVFWIFGCIKRLFWAETLHPNCLFICDSSFELLKFEKIFFLTKLLCFVFKWIPTNTKWFRANVMVTTHFLFVCKHLFLHNSFRFISFNNRTISCFLIKQIDFCLFSPFQYLPIFALMCKRNIIRKFPVEWKS